MKRLIVGLGLVAIAMGVGMTACDVAEARGKGGRGGHGGHGGHGGRGGHGGHGGHGNHGGGNHGGGKGGASVAAPTGTAPAFGGGMTTGSQGDRVTSAEAKLVGNGLLTPRQAQTDADTREALAEAGHFGLVTVDRINVDGSFTYSGYEWAVVAFAQKMKAKGYNMGWQGEDSTNLGNGLTTDAFGG